MALFTSYTLVVGESYYWTKGANETQLVSGGTTLTASGGFVATSTSATISGTAGAYTSTLVRTTVPFVPEKFVVKDGQVYIRDTSGKIYVYGGTDNNTFDYTSATVELPWLDMKSPSTRKQGLGVDAAFSGLWEVYARMDPKATDLVRVIQRGDPVSPSMVVDSTFDAGHFPFSDNGTHVKLKFISGIAAEQAKLGKAIFLYKLANKK